MRVLFLFCDSLRADRLRTVNPSIGVASPIDRWMERLGGICFANAYTPGPDTARSIASFYTGLYPRRHGCRKVAQSPGFYLETEQHLFRTLLEVGYELTCFLAPFSHKDGFLPRDTAERTQIFYDFSAATAAVSANRAERQVVLLCFDDCHDAVLEADDYYEGEARLSNALEQFFGQVAPDHFDKIILFSDHGCALEEREFERLNLLNDNRTQIALFVHERGARTLERRDELVTIMDIYPTVADWLGVQLQSPIDGTSLLQARSDRYIVIEDDWHFNRDWPNHLYNVAHIWAFRNGERFFVETLEGQTRLRTRIDGHFTDQPVIDAELLGTFRNTIAQHACFYAQNRRDYEHTRILRSDPSSSIVFSRSDYDTSGRRVRYTDGQPIRKAGYRRLPTRVKRSLRGLTRLRMSKVKRALKLLLWE